MLRRLILLTIGALLLSGTAPSASAIAPVDTTTKNKGLYISPVRDYLTLKTGDTATHALTVANLTDKPMAISTHIDQFSVADISYNFSFTSVKNDWVQFKEHTVLLKPNETHQLAYTVTVPANAAPGGHYYTLYASSTTVDGAATSTIQATMLLYLTVDGALVKTSEAVSESLPSLVVTPDITYSLDIKNTGNTHYFAYVSGMVDGIFYHNAPNGTSQLLMPDTVRSVSGTITSPLVPGVYKLTYTIQPDQGEALTGSRYFVYLPVWFIILFGFALILVGRALYRRARHEKTAAN